MVKSYLTSPTENNPEEVDASEITSGAIGSDPNPVRPFWTDGDEEEGAAEVAEDQVVDQHERQDENREISLALGINDQAGQTTGPEDPGNDLIEIKTELGQQEIKAALSRVIKIVSAMGGVPSGAPKHKFNLSDQSLHPMVIDVLLTGICGTGWWGWEPETLSYVFDNLRKFGMTITQVNRDKAQAMAVLHVTNYPWMDWHVFEKTCMALNGMSPEFTHVEEATPGMMLVAVEIMAKTAENRLSPQVVKYIAARCVANGQMIFPDPDYQDAVEREIRSLISHDVSPETAVGLRNIWEEFVAKNGMSVDPKVIDSLSEDDLGDVQVLRAYISMKYLAEENNNMQIQLNDLSAWCQNILR